MRRDNDDERPDGGDENLIQSVVRAMAILDAVTSLSEDRTATNIARHVGLHLTTAYRLLSTLVSAGYLVRHDRSYSVSPSKVFELSAGLDTGMLPSATARRAMNRLAEQTGESTYLSVWTGDDVVICATAEGSHAVRVASIRVGMKGHLNTRASGKALLAFGPPARLNDHLGANKLSRMTAHSINDATEFMEEIESIRQAGFAEDWEEFTEGVCGLAGPLYEGSTWPVTALTMTAPVGRFKANRDMYIRCLVEAQESVDGTSTRQPGRDASSAAPRDLS